MAGCKNPSLSSPGPVAALQHYHHHHSQHLCAGVSAEALQLADATAYIPMSGFVSSFNVSVAAALVFYEARRARLERLGRHCDLTDHDKQVLTAVMLLRHQVSHV